MYTNTDMAQTVATLTVKGICIFGFKWSQVRIHKVSLFFFFHLSHVSYFFSSICISENENIGIVSISFIVIHT